MQVMRDEGVQPPPFPPLQVGVTRDISFADSIHRPLEKFRAGFSQKVLTTSSQPSAIGNWVVGASRF